MWTEDFFDFAFIPNLDASLQELAKEAEPENWKYQNTSSDRPLPVLYNYIQYTYRKVAEEGKIALSEDGQYSCFNTGLVAEITRRQFLNTTEDKFSCFFHCA